MTVDAIVVAFNGDRWLQSCLEFVQGRSAGDVRVIVADNFGNTAIQPLVDGDRIVSAVLPGPLGFAEANNRVIVKIGLGQRFICFLNQDTKSPPGWLSRAAEFLENHPDIGAITPLVSTYEGKAWDPNFVACTKPLHTFWPDMADSARLADFYDVPAIPAPAMVIRTIVLKRVGGFDPIYGSYYEDYDLCHRIRRAGFRVGIWTGATVAHYSGSATSTAEAERRRHRQIVRNRLIYRVRTSDRGRMRQLARELLLELPRQVGRRLLRRPASVPMDVLFGGYLDSLRLIRRLVSESYDVRLWQRYLVELGWPSL